MKAKLTNSGTVLVMTIFVIALLSAVVIGILQMNTEEIQLMHNHVCAAEALATAEAGLNDAFAMIRDDSSWSTGFTDKAFNGGSYTVDVSGSLPSLTIESTGTSAQGYIAQVDVDTTIGTSSPYAVTINELRINE
jgi:type II secretory pathway component PulK